MSQVARAPIVINMKQYASLMQRVFKNIYPAAVKGVQLGAARSIPDLQKSTDTAPPASPRGTPGAVNTGNYRRNWRFTALPDGASLYNPVKYAGVIEEGRRPNNKFPPRAAIVRWIQLKMKKTREEAQKLAFVVQRAIAARGLQARKVLDTTVPTIEKNVRDEVQRAINDALAGKGP